MNFVAFLEQWNAQDAVSTDDVLGAFLPLVREVIAAHRAGMVAPLAGLGDLRVEQSRIWFEEGLRRTPLDNSAEIRRVAQSSRLPIEVMAEARRTSDIGDGEEQLLRSDIGDRGVPITRPVYLPGYVAWEHELAHHDPLTDVFSLGLILASLSCQLNLSEPQDLEALVVHRRNLFALNSRLHPASAQAIWRMTELDRHKRPQDLPALLRGLEHYRDQTISLEVDLARVPGFRTRDIRGRQQVVLHKLRDRLFDISRRNTLLHFRPTLQSISLTQASIPVLLDVRNVRPDQVLYWTDDLRLQIVDGKPISLNRHLNFSEALYLPSLLDRMIAEARRDQTEFGFVQLRLIVCFLAWANLKEKPIEQFHSPLALLPVKLTKNKGIRDTYSLEVLSTEAEINPVLRHQFRQLYHIDLPETIDLATTRLESLHELLTSKIQASEPAVTLNLIDRPRIDLIHEKARRRLDQYRRSARVSGRGVRHFGDLDYSYDPANFHPLGIKLFSAMVRTPGSHLREIIEERPRPRSYASGQDDRVVEAERTFYQVRDAEESNPYLWNFDLCNLTLANCHYRRMSLVRDYERILDNDLAHGAFDAVFSLAPRPARRELAEALPLEERYDVVPCDPTQAAAIAEARLGTNYIIQGPPGTGKSQTIANTIADFVARGKRVLFVCEKRAAIDVVYSRLRQCGLGPLCSLIHDSQSDKKEFVLDLKNTYEGFLTPEKGRPDGARRRKSALSKIAEHLGPLAAFEGGMSRPIVDRAEMTVRQLLDRSVELAPGRPPFEPEDLERFCGYDQWLAHSHRLAQIERMIRDIEPGGVFARHPLRRLASSLADGERPIEQVRQSVQNGLVSLDRLTQAVRNSGIPAEEWKTFAKTRQILDYMQQASVIAADGNFALVDAASERAKQFSAAMTRLAAAEQEVEIARQSTNGWRKKLKAEDVPNALELARQWQGKLFAWLSPDWWRLRSVLRRTYDFQSHTVRPTWVQVLTALDKEYAASRSIDQVSRDLQATFALPCDAREFAQRLTAFRESSSRLPESLARIHGALLRSSKAKSFIARALVVDEPAKELANQLTGVITDYEALTLADLHSELIGIQNAARQVPDVLSLLKEFANLPAALATILRQDELTVRQVESAAAMRTWDQLSRENRDLGRFDGRTRNRCADQLATGYDRWLAANGLEVCDRVRKKFLEHVRISNLAASQLSPADRDFKRRYSQGRRTLEHEFGKSMRYKAIRELVDGDAALVIADLKPVWLMSPLSVSDALPLNPRLFDVVIFDEASQVPLEESVPTLFRGQQVIIVGDEMQLPPTDFFSNKSPQEDDDLVIEEGGEQITYDLDSDSLLNHAARNLPSTMLGWHYRSRSESLISFSNWAFYGGRLLTVPERQLLPQPGDIGSSERAAAGHDGHASPHGDSPHDPAGLLLSRAVSFHQLANGVYDNRRNRREAVYIAELIANILKRRGGQSIGVVAFSEAQQSEIEAALDRLAQDDEEFRGLHEAELEREEDGQFVGLLVKNLENIQGDERDIVILSICYGPGPNGRMLMNFGPINKSGGEKRLNVAFSRAKLHMAVVSSIQHSAITNEYNDGANCLKNYLRYAEALTHGDGDSVHRVLSSVTRWKESAGGAKVEADDPVSMQLANALAERGFVIDRNVGQSHFRVDLAIRRSGDAKYALGIMVDTLAKYEHSDALEREMMRPHLLQSFGWPLATVLAKDWHDSPDSQLERIISLLEGKQDTAIDDLTADIDGADDEPLVDDQSNDEKMLLGPVTSEHTAECNGDGALGTELVASEISTNTAAESAATTVPLETADASHAPIEVGNASHRHFEFTSGKSNKYWAITVQGATYTVRYGRIGTNGQSYSKSFDNESAAKSEAESLIAAKTKKGYKERRSEM